MAIHYSKQIFKSGKAHTKYSQTTGKQTNRRIVSIFLKFQKLCLFCTREHDDTDELNNHFIIITLNFYSSITMPPVIIHFRRIQFEFRRWKIAMIQYRLCQVRNVMCYLKLRNDFRLNDFGRNVFDEMNLSNSHGRIVTICFRVE